ncbi:unnamed protein product [Rhizophagus irregularis]|nr:unnamed protein product [Rhizophagus irregularis]
MDKIVEKNAEEVPTWVTQSKMNSLGQFFKNFEDIYDTHLVDILQCKKIEEYIELEDKLIGPSNITKPGKLPIRLNKPDMKVPSVVYFLTVFLTKWAGLATKKIIEEYIECHVKAEIENERMEHDKKMAVAEFDELKWEYDRLSTAFDKLKKNSADSSLTNGLAINDLKGRIRNLEADVIIKENKIRNLEADVTAKEHIILEKSEQINMLWEKIRGLEAKMEKATCQNADMDLDKKQTKKKCPNKKRKRTQVQHTQNGMISKIKIGPIDDNRKEDLEKYYAEQSFCKRLEDDNQQDDCLIIRYFAKTYRATFGKIIRVNGIRYIILYFSTEDKLMKAVMDLLKTYKVGLELLIKKENDFIDDTGELKEFNKTLKWRNATTSRSRGLRMEREQHEEMPKNFASSSRRQ